MNDNQSAARILQRQMQCTFYCVNHPSLYLIMYICMTDSLSLSETPIPKIKKGQFFDTPKSLTVMCTLFYSASSIPTLILEDSKKKITGKSPSLFLM